MKKPSRIPVIRKSRSRNKRRDPPSNGGKITVIVLDDDLFVCRALQTQLEILGFNVMLFQSAMSLLESKVPTADACLLVDVYMPGMSGIELCLRLGAEGSALPIILMSGRDDDDTRRGMKEAQPAATLFKPFSQEALLHAIGTATGHGPSRRPRCSHR